MKPNYIFCLILFLVVGPIEAQVNKDSIFQAIYTLENEEKVDAMAEFAISNFNSDPKLSDSLIEVMMSLSDELEYTIGKVQALKIKGARLSVNYKLEEANKVLKEALALAEESGFESGVSTVNYSIGANYLRQSLYDIAAENFIAGIASARKLQNNEYLIGNLLNLGIVYTELKQFDRAEKILKEGLTISENVGNDLRRVQFIGNLGNLEEARANYTLSEDYLLKSLEGIKALNVLSLAPPVWMNLGKVNSSLGRTKVGLLYIDSAFVFAEQRKDFRTMTRALNYQGRFLYRLKRYSESEKVLKRVLAMKEGFAENPLTLFQLYQLAVDLNEVKGDYERALFYRNEAIEVRDSITARSNKVRIAAINSDFELSELKNKVALEVKNLEISQLKVEQRNLTILILSLVLVASLCVYLINRKRHINKLLIAERDKQLYLKQTELNELQISRQHEKLEQYEDKLNKQVAHSEKAKELMNLLQKGNLQAQDWASFRFSFVEYAPEFFAEMEVFGLNTNEERLSLLIRLGLATKEMAHLLAVTPNSIIKAKSRLAVKFNIPTQEVDQFVKSL